MKIWIPVAIVVIVLLAVMGLLPLPGQKDNVTPHSEPATAEGVSPPQPKAPVGPPPSPPSQAGANAEAPPPGGTPAPSPGGPADSVSGHTVTGDAPARGAQSGSAR